MPTSSPVLDPWFAQKVASITNLASALDLGAGDGKRGAQIRQIFKDAKIIGVDASDNEPRTQAYSEWRKENIVEMIEKPEVSGGPFDVIVLGDILEHLPHSKARDVVEWAINNGRFVICLWPEGMAQGAVFGEYEVHRSCWHLTGFLSYDIIEYRAQPTPGFLYCGIVLRGWVK